MHADLERGLSHRMKWIAQAGHAAIATQKIKVGAELTPLALAVAGEEGEEPGVLRLSILTTTRWELETPNSPRCRHVYMERGWMANEIYLE